MRIEEWRAERRRKKLSQVSQVSAISEPQPESSTSISTSNSQWFFVYFSIQYTWCLYVPSYTEYLHTVYMVSDRIFVIFIVFNLEIIVFESFSLCIWEIFI